jgi:hypothetical protein
LQDSSHSKNIALACNSQRKGTSLAGGSGDFHSARTDNEDRTAFIAFTKENIATPIFHLD